MPIEICNQMVYEWSNVNRAGLSIYKYENWAFFATQLNVNGGWG